MSGKVQNANTHSLQCQNHEHAHSSQSVQGSVQWGDGTLHMGSIRRKAHSLPQNAHSIGQYSSGALEEMSQRVQKESTLHPICRSSSNVQPNQLDCPARLYLKDPPRSHGVEHHSSRHLRFDGQGAVDADRRARAAHVARKLVRARCQQDLVDRAVCDSCGELAHGACRHFVQMPAAQCHVGSGRRHDGSCGAAADDHRAWRARGAWRTAALCATTAKPC